MQTLPSALARSLGDAVRLSSPVQSLVQKQEGYTVSFSTEGVTKSVDARAVILAVPAFIAAELLAPMPGNISTTLRSVEYSPVATVFLGYERKAIHHLLDGFGVLIPQKEERSILGTLWSSSLFADRAPDGHAGFTVFVGGARQPEKLEGNDADLLQLCESELESIMHILGKPVYYRMTRWEKAIPQYTLGYSRIIDACASLHAARPGLTLCSNYLGGISVGDCVMSARKTADDIGSYLGSSAS